MPYRKTPLLNGKIYHVFNRGVAKLPIFYTDSDFKHYLETLYFYQFGDKKSKFSHIKRFKNNYIDTGKKTVEIICYCLMPNHFHLLLRQKNDNGILDFMKKVSNSYAKYFNTKHERVGPLFQGRFKSVHIDDDEQLLHVSRYIHLNPVVSHINSNVEDYRWSSYEAYVTNSLNKLVTTEPVLQMFRNREEYKKFVLDHIGYAKEIELIKHKIFD